VDPWKATGLDDEALEFFRVSDEADAVHGNETVAIIARYTPADREEEVLKVLGESMRYLRRMMGGLWELAQRVGEEGK
jgi:pyrroloquinoline quinone (PQQ) biosynthesis protein C